MTAVAAVALLLCQSAALAQACGMGVAQQDTGVVQQSCHGGGEQQESQSPAGASDCSHYASLSLPNLPLFSVMDLPALTVRVEPAVAVIGSAALEPLESGLRPPPHSILHCCLRN